MRNRNHNATGEYVGPLKRVHRPGGVASLACDCLRDGTLDVCLETGRVFGVRRELRPSVSHKGYLYVCLSREKPHRRGKPHGGRWRRRMSAWVHRLVMMKKLAVDAHGSVWREHVRDIPPHIDVDHYDRVRANNRATNLRLANHDVHAKRSSRELTADELAAVSEFEAA